MRGVSVVFWGNRPGVGVTAATVALTVAMAQMNDCDCAVTRAGPTDHDLEEALLGRTRAAEVLKGSGLDAVYLNIRSERADPGALAGCLVRADGHISLVPGSEMSREMSETPIIRLMLKRAVSMLTESFDYTFIDLAQADSVSGKELLESADLVVVVLRQDRRMIDQVLKAEGLSDKRKMYLFNGYDSDSRYSLLNIRLIYRQLGRRNCFVLPRSASFMDAFADGNAIRFIKEGLATDGESGESAFFKALQKTVKGMGRLIRRHGSGVSR